MGDTLNFTIFGNHCLLVHNNVPLSDADSDAQVDELAKICARVQPGEPWGVIVLTEGEAPNARQRGIVDKRPEIPRITPASVLSPSPVTRGIITALSWMGRGGIEAFKPTEYERAFDHVKLPRGRHAEALRLMLDMKRKFVKTNKLFTKEELLEKRLDELRAKAS